MKNTQKKTHKTEIRLDQKEWKESKISVTQISRRSTSVDDNAKSTQRFSYTHTTTTDSIHLFVANKKVEKNNENDRFTKDNQ